MFPSLSVLFARTNILWQKPKNLMYCPTSEIHSKHHFHTSGETKSLCVHRILSITCHKKWFKLELRVPLASEDKILYNKTVSVGWSGMYYFHLKIKPSNKAADLSWIRVCCISILEICFLFSVYISEMSVCKVFIVFLPFLHSNNIFPW